MNLDEYVNTKREELKKVFEDGFKMHGKDFYIGYILGAIDDNCIKPDDGWMELPAEKLLDLCFQAYSTVVKKILNGETLPSELRNVNLKSIRTH